MFAFRMVMVARVGDQVYSDEQEFFKCNTQTPGCDQVLFTRIFVKFAKTHTFQVCFSMFSPISHLRFWSVMVIVTATPPIVFFAYASHIITRWVWFFGDACLISWWHLNFSKTSALSLGNVHLEFSTGMYFEFNSQLDLKEVCYCVE